MVAPLLFGLVFYMLVLMFFDSVEMLTENFFSREVLFIIGLTFVFFEFNRLVIVFLNIFYKNKKKQASRIPIQFIIAIVVTVLSISLILYYYFVSIEGFSTIKTELITFNSIYLFAGFFYHLYYFSMEFLYKKNDKLVQKELIRKNNLELELNAYKNQVNPKFLFLVLEIIIAELHRDKKHSDELIENLAAVYRYTLDNQKSDLILVQDEIDSLDPVYFIFKSKYGASIIIEKEIDNVDDFFLIPGTLQIIFENTVMNSIITEKIPLRFKIQNQDNKLIIRYEQSKKLTPGQFGENRIKHLGKTYAYYSNSGFKMEKENGCIVYEIPLLEVDEE